MVVTNKSTSVEAPAPPDSCPHMIKLAKHLGVKRHPTTGQFWVHECVNKRCRRLVPVSMQRCCYCGSTDFKDLDQEIRVSAGVCRYYCRDCKKFTEGCTITTCCHCQSANLKLADPV